MGIVIFFNCVKFCWYCLVLLLNFIWILLNLVGIILVIVLLLMVWCSFLKDGFNFFFIFLVFLIILDSIGIYVWIVVFFMYKFFFLN